MELLNNPEKVKNFLMTADNLNKSDIDKKQSERFNKIFGSSFNRNFFFENDLNKFYFTIKEAKRMDGFLARALNQISQKAIKNGWSFHCENQKNIKVIEKRFNELLFDSNLTIRMFLREIVKNCVSYSNAFVLKSYSGTGKKKKLSFLTLLPSVGWEALESRGPFVTKWQFTPANSSANTFDGSDIVHFHSNKEIDDIFGTPFVSSVLEDAQLLRDLEGIALEQYFAHAQKKTVFFVGNQNTPGTAKEIEQLKGTLNSLDDNTDLIVTSRVKFEILETSYTEPTLLMNTLKERIFAGLLMSSSGMGISGAGRQDADTQSTKELVIVEDFQDAIEDILNNTIIKELCFEEFGKYDFENAVEFCFNENFDEKERTDNHILNMYNSGAIDFDEFRKKTKNPSINFNEQRAIENKKLKITEEEAKIAKKYTVKTTAGSSATPASKLTKNKTTPTNQHGKKTSSAPSKKD